MSYDMDIETLSYIIRMYERKSKRENADNFTYALELEALNDAISALKTLQDMGEAMNQFLRENHKEN